MAIDPRDKALWDKQLKDYLRKAAETPAVPISEYGKAYSHKNCGLMPEPLTPDTMPMLGSDRMCLGCGAKPLPDGNLPCGH
jgi:hypothetical protein